MAKRKLIMKILVTGSKGMVGTALINNLKTIKDGTNKTRPNIHIDEIFEYDIGDEAKLDEYCKKADFIFNFAGVNRPKDSNDFHRGNFDFSLLLLKTLKKYNNRAPVMLSSSIQATLIGRYNNDYGKSKKEAEELFFKYGKESNIKVFIYRFPNIMGHSRPNYNSAISTFCWAVANDQPYTINDKSTKLELLYIDDLIDGMYDLLENKEIRCEYDKTNPIIKKNGKYCLIPTTHNVTLGEVINLLNKFKNQPISLMMPKIPNNSFAKKLYSLYLTYLPVNKFKYSLKMNTDNRGSFTELLHTEDCGQVSVNISKPGITKGNHWHNSKWELFIVVHGKALIQERNINTNELIEFEVNGKNIEAVYMIPGWTHNIINLSRKEKLITVIICNEIFDKLKSDTFIRKVKTIL